MLLGAGYGEHMLTLSERPSDGDLRGSGAVTFCDTTHDVDDALVMCLRFGLEPWVVRAVVVGLQCLGVDRAGQEAPSQGENATNAAPLSAHQPTTSPDA